ncbi:MAG: cytochrome c family protein [Hyphomicrobiaceae bacterium]|nr:cytochrome c family protein [Hyphomicrobiaceae bacterium]
MAHEKIAERSQSLSVPDGVRLHCVMRGALRRARVLLVAAWVVFAVILAAPTGSLAQDARNGQHAFKKCLLCHVLDPAGKDLLAPPLNNIIGRPAGAIRGFEYSEIMKTAGSKGLVWTPDALFYFLDRPEEFMPGTYMAFPGLEEQERRDVIAYLEFYSRETARLEAQKAASSAAPSKATQKQPSAQQPLAQQPQPQKQQAPVRPSTSQAGRTTTAPIQQPNNTNNR